MNLRLIELIAEIALELGEHVIVPIIQAIFHDHTEDQKKEIADKTKSKMKEIVLPAPKETVRK